MTQGTPSPPTEPTLTLQDNAPDTPFPKPCPNGPKPASQICLVFLPTSVNVPLVATLLYLGVAQEASVWWMGKVQMELRNASGLKCPHPFVGGLSRGETDLRMGREKAKSQARGQLQTMPSLSVPELGVVREVEIQTSMSKS